MNPTSPSPDGHPPASREEVMAMLFATMVMQQAQMALMLLGQMPHPETGQTVLDLEGAQMFIDQLEMLEVKTQGNLSKEEADLLKQSLVGTRMAYVQAAQLHAPGAAPAAPSIPASPSAEQPAPMPETAAVPAAADEESRKRFSKKY